MILPRRIMKKAPLPWSIYGASDQPNLIDVIRRRFMKMYGAERTNLSTAERKAWGEFLASHGIFWDVKVSKIHDWDGWEFFQVRGVLKARPNGLKEHVRVSGYYVPPDLALKMLVLNDLP